MSSTCAGRASVQSNARAWSAQAGSRQKVQREPGRFSSARIAPQHVDRFSATKQGFVFASLLRGERGFIVGRIVGPSRHKHNAVGVEREDATVAEIKSAQAHRGFFGEEQRRDRRSPTLECASLSDIGKGVHRRTSDFEQPEPQVRAF